MGGGDGDDDGRCDVEADVNPLVATLRKRVLIGDGVRGSGVVFLEGVRVMKAPPPLRGVGVSGGEGRSLSLSRLVRVDRVGVSWVKVGVDGDGGMPGV